MVDAFVYMYVLGAGASLGVATVVYLAWKVIQRSVKKKKGDKLSGLIK
ncbi:hypothetical protein SAMN04488134_11350 [Amphibacillus marinus]|uniref:Uncharacterized protein n=1 Tax=Amphibacillus marinus TaxID=872970 RepID=A0A1H8SPC1_9BACI|nr:hypothetical protein [Amphibacillus marinus]SEO80174.1 hypothetical protein SAMN04488134_11350 [Amphibacillus marinus]